MENKKQRCYIGSGVTSILIAMIILMLSCFAALTFVSAESEMKMSRKSEQYCNNYYAAESLAVDVLSDLLDGKINEDKTGKIIYNKNKDYIVITKTNDKFHYEIPVNNKQKLAVTTTINGSHADILSWTVI